MNNTKENEKYFNTLFESQVIKHVQSRDGQFVSTKIICNNPALDSLFKKLYKDYKVKEAFNDFYSECIYWSWVACMKFEIKDGKSWSGVFEGTDKANIGRLIRNIQITVKNEIYRYINSGAKFTRGTVDGVKNQHVTLKFDISSLDALISSDANEGTIVDLIGEEQNFFKTIDLAEYQISYFAQWFRKNKATILESSQLIFLNQLEKVRKVEGYTINDTEEVLGMSNSAVNSRLRRIKSRIATTYLKENPEGHLNRLQMTIADEMELFAPVIDIVEGDDLLRQNELLADWILQNVEIQKVANMLYDNLDQEQSIELTKAIKKAPGGQKLSPSIIYTFINEVEKRLEELKNTNTTVTPLSKAPNYISKAYEAKKKDLDNAPVVVFDLEGNLIRLESVKPKKRKANIQFVLPNGMHLPI